MQSTIYCIGKPVKIRILSDEQIRGVKMSKEVMYGSLEEIKEACKQNGIDIVKDDGNYKTVYEVLGELSHKVFN